MELRCGGALRGGGGGALRGGGGALRGGGGALQGGGGALQGGGGGAWQRLRGGLGGNVVLQQRDWHRSKNDAAAYLRSARKRRVIQPKRFPN